jgi:hypothetical protein
MSALDQLVASWKEERAMLARQTARTCMSQRGYALLQKDQAEEVRAAYQSADEGT